MKDQLVYHSKFAVELVFQAMYSDNLDSVRLFINKIDLLEAAVARGYLDLDGQSLNEYVLGLYKKLESRLKEACEANSIADFKTHIISAKNPATVHHALNEIISSCARRVNQK